MLARVLWLRERRWIGYAVALIGPFFGLYVHFALVTALESASFLTFFPGITFASLLGGRLAGGLATLISAALAIYYLLPPLHHPVISWPGGYVEIIAFLVVAAFAVALIDHTVEISVNLARVSRLLRANNERLTQKDQDQAAQLQAKDALIRTFFDYSSQCHAVFTVTEDGKFRYEEVNPATLQLYGLPRDQVIGLTIDDLFESGQAAELNAGLRRCLQTNAPHQYERVNGDSVIEAVATPVATGEGGFKRVIVTASDITARRNLEQQLRQSQKMEAVGHLTGGIAHDFNNLLTGISGSLELLEIRISQGRMGELQRYLQTAKGAARRAASLTHRLLAFSRRQTLDSQPTDVNRLLGELDELVRRTVGPRITLELVTAMGLWPVLIDQNQLENAVLNLCINARDAMPDGGRLTIETANRWLDERTAKERDLAAGQYVSVCVSDTGVGMPPEVVSRAFDPFFTTKPLGQGTGLGLSMVYGFARQSGGQVRIYSELNKGTMVCLYLPRHFGEHAPDQASAEPVGVLPAEAGETVLVVDDEPSVRMLVTEVLEEMGITTVEAGDGQAGLQVLESGRRIDLLITDVGLPGEINGRQLADAGLNLRPGLRVLFITGYAENAVVGDGHLKHGMQILTKPFAMADLARRVRDIIAAA
jgi:PAS domain S-box-containing protein